MENPETIEEIRASDLPLYSIGPKIGKRVKTFLYFSLSGFDSLMTSPYAKPALLLAHRGYRVISATLPGHENNEKPSNIKSLWGENPHLLTHFFSAMETALEDIDDSIEGPIAALGLSRGALIACHLAARIDKIDTILGYAPLTFLEGSDQFDLIYLKEALKQKRIRFSIGHDDTLVDTMRVIETVKAFIDSTDAKHRQNCSIDLVMTPSIGKYGHGTSEQTFMQGVSWLLN